MRRANERIGKGWLIGLAAMLVAMLAAGCSQAVPTPSAPEAVHAAYLDLSANMSDLRTRVAEWQKGDANSLKIAQEKLDRTGVVLGSVTWPQMMVVAIDKARAAVDPMAKAIKAGDAAAAEAAAKAVGEASHDVTHAFYGEFLPSADPSRAGPMAAHAIYLDLAANLADLQARVGQWQNGDESGLSIAKEKGDRIDILLLDMSSTRVMSKRVQTLMRDLASVRMALENGDAAAAQQALKPLAEASGALTQEAYVWIEIVGAGNDPACIYASYLDVSRSLTEARAAAADWQQGRNDRLGVAADRLAQAQVVLEHPLWPTAMGTAVDGARAGVAALTDALAAKNTVAAEAASKNLGDAAHDLTHAFYGDWLPTAQFAPGQATSTTAQPAAQASAHSHSEQSSTGPAPASGPDWPVLGGFGGALALVVIVAALTRPKGNLARRRPSLETGQSQGY